MTRWIHPKFLEDAALYADAQDYWAQMWDRVLSITHYEEPWKPWWQNTLLDGNPIFTAVCPALGRGVRIIQEPPGDSDDIDLDWWVDYTGDREDPATVRELVIACCPSSENRAQTMRLLQRWVSAGRVDSQGAEPAYVAELSGRGAVTPAVLSASA